MTADFAPAATLARPAGRRLGLRRALSAQGAALASQLFGSLQLLQQLEAMECGIELPRSEQVCVLH